jgi:hypothetical protein
LLSKGTFFVSTFSTLHKYTQAPNVIAQYNIHAQQQQQEQQQPPCLFLYAFFAVGRTTNPKPPTPIAPLSSSRSHFPALGTYTQKRALPESPLSFAAACPSRP